MKTLYFIRHGKAEDKVPGQSDFDRDLATKGKQDAQIMGKKQRIQGLQPDLILTSPAPRALNTAKQFAEALAYPEEQIETDQKLYEATYEQLMERIYQLDDTYETVMLFGHNPAISEVVIELSREKGDILPTAGITGLSFNVEKWNEVAPENAYFRTQDFPAKGISG
jgi:phosphohistidine phosphatase